MSAALSLPPILEPRVLLEVARRMTEERLGRLMDLEQELVELIDKIEVVKDEITRGQNAQIQMLLVIARAPR